MLELGLGQSEVAGPADPGDVGGLAHGPLDAGAGGVAGFPLCRGLLGAGAGDRVVQFAGADGDLAAPAAGAQLACRAGGARGRGQDTTIASSWRFRHGVQVLLATPCGQVACRAPESEANAALSYRAPALAWAELSSSIGLTSVIPKMRAAWMISSADG